MSLARSENQRTRMGVLPRCLLRWYRTANLGRANGGRAGHPSEVGDDGDPYEP